MRPKEAPLEIAVSAPPARKGTSHVAIALRGDPRSLRYVSDGPVFLYVKPGRHVLLVGAGERSLERVVEVRSCDSMSVMFDVARETGALFSGSAAAVSAYPRGRRRARGGGARARGPDPGRDQAARRPRCARTATSPARRARSRPRATCAARPSCARPRRTRAGAAALFEAAEDFDKAGDAYRAAGDFAAAARAYERAGELEQAIACCKETDDSEQPARAVREERELLRRGRARRDPEADRARDPQPARRWNALDPNYAAAWRRLVELHVERGQLPVALEKLDELLEASGRRSDAAVAAARGEGGAAREAGPPRRRDRGVGGDRGARSEVPRFRGTRRRASREAGAAAPEPAASPRPRRPRAATRSRRSSAAARWAWCTRRATSTWGASSR